MAISPLITLNGLDLTDQGRTYEYGLDFRVVDLELANGEKRRYSKAIKTTLKLKWEWLPGSNTHTYDHKVGRDAIWFIIISGTSLTVVINNLDGTDLITLSMLTDSYSEEIVRRDKTLNDIFYNVSLDLTEI